MSHLRGGKVNVYLIQEYAQRQLFSLLEKCNGRKAIVWDKELISPIGLIVGFMLLKEHEVYTMFLLQPGALPKNNMKHIIFISRPKLHLMQYIAENVLHEKADPGDNNKQFHLFYVPYESTMCKIKLENSKMMGSLNMIENFRCLLFPYDNDLITFGLPHTFREYYLEGDPTCLFQVAQAIVEIQKLYGPIPKVWGKGTTAKIVWELVQRLNRENGDNKPNSRSCIDQILLLDRSVDLITPLATQLTYEGLIDEIFGITDGKLEFSSQLHNTNDSLASNLAAENKEPKTLNSSDKLFAELRDKNFRAVGPILSKQARLISSQLEKRHHETNVQEIKQFVAKLPSMLADKKALATHTTIAEHIKDYTGADSFLDNLQTEQEFLNCIDVDKPNSHIEDLIAQGAPIEKVLRLICLQCLTGSGLKQKLLEYYIKELVQVYGIQTYLSISNLEKIGLLRVQSGSRQYAVLRKTLRLTMEDTSETSPVDISYVHSGYAPLSVRLAEPLMKSGGWKQLHDVLGPLPGPTLDEGPFNYYSSSSQGTTDAPSVVLVVFIGGCTFAEISALRFLSQQEDSNVEFVVATTNIINGTNFINCLIKPLQTS